MSTLLPYLASLRPLKVDLIPDFLGSELAIVNVDAIIQIYTREQHTTSNGLKIHQNSLTVAWCVERYVKSLMDARANIKIVVFDRKPVSYQERYMRQQIIGHLKQQNCGLQIFGKWDDQEWKIFCERERPYCMLSTLDTEEDLQIMYKAIESRISFAVLPNTHISTGRIETYLYEYNKGDPLTDELKQSYYTEEEYHLRNIEATQKDLEPAHKPSSPKEIRYYNLLLLSKILAKKLPLNERCLPPLFGVDESQNKIIDQTLTFYYQQAIEADKVELGEIDHILYMHTLQAMEGDSQNATLTSEVLREWEAVKVSGEAQSLDINWTIQAPPAHSKTTMLPYEQELIRQYLPEDPVEVRDEDLHETVASLALSAPRYKVEKKFGRRGAERKGDQRQAAWMVRYARSLTNAEPEVITLLSKTAKPSTKGPSAKALALMTANTSKKGDAKKMKEDDLWKSIVQGMTGMQLNHQIDKLRAFIKKIDTDKQTDSGQQLKREVLLFEALLNMELWAEACDTKNMEGVKYAVTCFDLCIKIMKSSMPKAVAAKKSKKSAAVDPAMELLRAKSEEIDQNAASMLRAIGMSEAIDFDFDTIPSSKERKKRSTNLSYPFPHFSSSKTDFHVPGSRTEFQLAHCGHILDRSINSKADSRVKFIPDEWQRNVLDYVDQDESIFIVAPTSAGKTFIAYYAMEKVLRDSDDGIVIYIAPAKALVNQVAAEVVARYKKEYKYPGQNLWSVQTNEFSVQDPLKCQVLITVPEVILGYLMIPELVASWVPKIKRIIFDEVHFIGQSEGGMMWEQLILLTQCPIIALSATVGNPSEFYKWLENVQKAHKTKMHMVVHKQRYSDLRKLAFMPSRQFPTFRGFEHQEVFDPLVSIHPVAALSFGVAAAPADLDLEPRDALALYIALENSYDDLDEDLDPDEYFADIKVIKKIDAHVYGEKLKAVLADLKANHPEIHSKVLDELSKNLFRRAALNEPIFEKINSNKVSDAVDSYALAAVVPLVKQLHQENKLPAMIFNWDREAVEALAKKLFDTLNDAEEHYKNTDSKYIAKLRNWERQQILQQEHAAARTAALEANNMKAVEELDKQPVEVSPFDPKAALPDFSLHNEKSGVSKADFEEELSKLWKDEQTKWWALSLARGVGVHHEGLPLKYRQVVERLYRKGFLRVVFATGTLSLGINMPAVTTCFLGDSAELNALNYRQSAGRAGRRGHDLLGNVVFAGIPKEKIYRLMASGLSDLTGHFPLSNSLVLRLHAPLSTTNSKSATTAEKMTRAIFQMDKLSLGSSIEHKQIMYHMRFSIAYSRRLGLLNKQGDPSGLFALAGQLQRCEPFNFAFALLLNSGFFFDYIPRYASDPDDTLLELLAVLSNLFGRVEMNPQIQLLSKITPRISQTLMLSQLPEKASDILQHEEAQTVKLYHSYLSTCAKQTTSQHASILPLSGRSYENASGSEMKITETLKSRSLSYEIRSPFAALMGHDDTFHSVSELNRTLRHDVPVEGTGLPSFEELKMPMNSFIVDFFKQGTLSSLSTVNKLRKGEVWYLIRAYTSNVQDLRNTLEGFLRDDMLSKKKDAPREEEEEEEEEDDDASEATTDTRPGYSRYKEVPPIKLDKKYRNEDLYQFYLILCQLQLQFDSKFHKTFA